MLPHHHHKVHRPQQGRRSFLSYRSALLLALLVFCVVQVRQQSNLKPSTPLHPAHDLQQWRRRCRRQPTLPSCQRSRAAPPPVSPHAGGGGCHLLQPHRCQQGGMCSWHTAFWAMRRGLVASNASCSVPPCCVVHTQHRIFSLLHAVALCRSGGKRLQQSTARRLPFRLMRAARRLGRALRRPRRRPARSL